MVIIFNKNYFFLAFGVVTVYCVLVLTKLFLLDVLEFIFKSSFLNCFWLSVLRCMFMAENLSLLLYIHALSLNEGLSVFPSVGPLVM